MNEEACKHPERPAGKYPLRWMGASCYPCFLHAQATLRSGYDPLLTNIHTRSEKVRLSVRVEQWAKNHADRSLAPKDGES